MVWKKCILQNYYPESRMRSPLCRPTQCRSFSCNTLVQQTANWAGEVIILAPAIIIIALVPAKMLWKTDEIGFLKFPPFQLYFLLQWYHEAKKSLDCMIIVFVSPAPMGNLICKWPLLYSVCAYLLFYPAEICFRDYTSYQW